MKKAALLFLFVSLQMTFLWAQDKNYSEWYLQREDVEIYVKEKGTGNDTLIVVHGGFGANHDYMEDAVKGLEQKFHLVFYDQRGSLLSPTDKKNLSFQKNVDDLYELIKALKLKKVKLLCHSMGTLLGMEFTKQHPGLVTNIVLTGTPPLKSDSLHSIFSERYHTQVNFLLNRKEVREFIQPYKDRGIDSLKSVRDIATSSLSHKELTDYWRLKFAAVNIYDVKKYNLVKGGKAYYKSDASIISETVDWNYDYRSVLNNTKTTIINGAFDFFDFNTEILQKQLKAYSNIQLHMIEDAGHNAWIDQPKLFQKYLLGGVDDGNH